MRDILGTEIGIGDKVVCVHPDRKQELAVGTVVSLGPKWPTVEYQNRTRYHRPEYYYGQPKEGWEFEDEKKDYVVGPWRTQKTSRNPKAVVVIEKAH